MYFLVALRDQGPRRVPLSPSLSLSLSLPSLLFQVPRAVEKGTSQRGESEVSMLVRRKKKTETPPRVSVHSPLSPSALPHLSSSRDTWM